MHLWERSEGVKQKVKFLLTAVVSNTDRLTRNGVPVLLISSVLALILIQ